MVITIFPRYTALLCNEEEIFIKGIDTYILVRFLVNDDPEQAAPNLHSDLCLLFPVSCFLRIDGNHNF